MGGDHLRARGGVTGADKGMIARTCEVHTENQNLSGAGACNLSNPLILLFLVLPNKLTIIHCDCPCCMDSRDHLSAEVIFLKLPDTVSLAGRKTGRPEP